MTPDPKIKVDWTGVALKSLKIGIMIAIPLAVVLPIGAGIQSCREDEAFEKEQKVLAQQKKDNAPCQDTIMQLGCKDEGKFVCHPGAELIVNHAVIECRCPRVKKEQ